MPTVIKKQSLPDAKSKADQDKDNKVKNKRTSKTSSSVLVHGTGAPYLALFNGGGAPLMNSITGLPLGVYINQFEIHLGEEDDKDNGGTIKIETADPDTVDIGDIQEGQDIMVQWGYIYPDGSSKSSKVHTLQINQMDQSFDDQGTHITLTIKDKTANLRSEIPFKLDGTGKTFLDYMDSGFDGQVGIIIERFGK